MKIELLSRDKNKNRMALAEAQREVSEIEQQVATIDDQDPRNKPFLDKLTTAKAKVEKLQSSM